MNIPLSTRLKQCAAFVAPGSRVADVGCDHGYLSIHLLLTGNASQVYAADIRPGPLQSAVNNAEKFEVREQISFYLSDGVRSIPRDFDTLIIAGMGADVMQSILSAAPWLADEKYHLILQCQSRTPYLRKYLADHGWTIRQEAVVKDGRFLYTVMDVVRGQAPLTWAQCYFPPALLVNPGEETPHYYEQVLSRLRLEAQGDRQAELQAILSDLESRKEDVYGSHR